MFSQAWCATGNCFSLQKEHDVAIKFFQRAMQVNPEFAYAYTLLGHEYVLIEELDKALAAFQSAVRINPRHYNAWWAWRRFIFSGLFWNYILAFYSWVTTQIHAGSLFFIFFSCNCLDVAVNWSLNTKPPGMASEWFITSRRNFHWQEFIMRRLLPSIQRTRLSYVMLLL